MPCSSILYLEEQGCGGLVAMYLKPVEVWNVQVEVPVPVGEQLPEVMTYYLSMQAASAMD
jgi:hypothetical protein